MSVLEDIRAKYAKVEKVTDDYGRIISVRKLTVAQKIHVMEWAQSDKNEVNATILCAASVSAINDNPFTFPRTRQELDAVIDMLDDPGIMAVSKALEKLFALEQSERETIAAAKNSPATASLDSSLS